MKSLEHYLSLNYHKTVTRDEEGDYIVEVEELPGCVADGSTPDEAFVNLDDAMKSWLTSRMDAGLEVPEPRTDEYSGRILVRMAKSLHRRLAAQSVHEGTSLNQLIVTLLAEGSTRCELSAYRMIEANYVAADPAFGSVPFEFAGALQGNYSSGWTMVSGHNIRSRYCREEPMLLLCGATHNQSPVLGLLTNIGGPECGLDPAIIPINHTTVSNRKKSGA